MSRIFDANAQTTGRDLRGGVVVRPLGGLPAAAGRGRSLPVRWEP